MLNDLSDLLDSWQSCREDMREQVLDPDGDVRLVFSSKNIVVSSVEDINLITAEIWNAMDEERARQTRMHQTVTTSLSDASEVLDDSIRDDSASMPSDPEHDLKLRKATYPCETNDIEVRVSSKHLALVSPVFRALFSSAFQEGSRLREAYTVTVPLPEDFVCGMVVLLKVLHLDFGQTKMSPSLLMQIALMADKYDIASRIVYWSRLWCAEIDKYIPPKWDESVISWISLFSMLKIVDLKERMAVIARGYITETTSFGDLPIQDIIGKC